MSWSVIAVTCKTREYADAVREELVLRQKCKTLPKDITLVCVEDPQEGLGSGGATLNALLVIAERLSAKKNLTVVSTDILQNAKILIIHLGRYFNYDPCGRAFTTLPYRRQGVEMASLLTNFDALYQTMSCQLDPGSPPGLWVCSSDMLLSLPQNTVIDWKNFESDVVCLSVPSSVDYALDHGVYKINDEGCVDDIIYRGSREEVKTCLLPSSGDSSSNTVSLVSGIVYFSSSVAEKLLSLVTCSPLDACTYMGLDSGVEPIQISLYFDILLAMVDGINKDDFVAGKRGSSFGHKNTEKRYRDMERVRTALWDRLNSSKIKAVVVQNGVHRYLDISDTPKEYTEKLKANRPRQFSDYQMCERCHAYVMEGSTIGKDCIIVNSLIEDAVVVEEGCFISHSHLKGDIKIGKNCVLIGIDEESSELITTIPDFSFVMGANVTIAGLGRKKVFCCLWGSDKFSISSNIDDVISSVESSEKSGVNRTLLLELVKDSGPLPQNYYNHMPGRKKENILRQNTLFMAKLFPVLHRFETTNVKDCLVLLSDSITDHELEKWKSSWKFSEHDILEHTDHQAEFECRRNLFVKIACEKIRFSLVNNIPNDLQPLYVLPVLLKKHEMLLQALDEAALTCVKLDRAHLCARVFSCIAEVLARAAGENYGVRSGPAANKNWRRALLYLERKELNDGIKALSRIRDSWLANSDLLLRAARHYERAEHIFIRHACASVSHFISTVPASMMDSNSWLVCESAARIDLSGGWSDTPPICYENGGCVVNVALKMENKRPIGARVRFIKKPVVVMTMLGEDNLSTTRIVCENLESFKDYCQPSAQGSLLKACCILAEIVSLDSNLTLKEQLLQKYGQGIEIQTWSRIPRGSGMGTSSIMAGVIIAALLRAVGRVADLDSVIHAVVMVEQMLTTGGGWQDQVGGLVGGIKRCSSNAELPLHVVTEPILVPKDFIMSLGSRMKLVYTGKTRLARNMLQDVLRNWYLRKPEIIENCKNLVTNAMKCKKAFEGGDLETVGACVNEYWKQKKIMAPGCEPSSCAEMMRVLSPHVVGQTLAGAGGGGFLCIILKDPKPKEFVEGLLRDLPGAEDCKVYDVTIDETGAEIYQTKADELQSYLF